MNKALIKIEKQRIGNEEINAVDARELHTFLESRQDFSNWIKNRIKKYDFVQGIDFIKFNNFIEQVSGTKARIDYTLSINMAKELSMVERNKKGKQARLYFIECERIVKENKLPDFTNPVIAARAWADAEEGRLKGLEEIEKKRKIIEYQKPKVQFANAVNKSKTTILIGELAKLLKQNGYDIGQNRLFKQLRNQGFLIKRKGSDFNMPTQKSMNLKLFKIKEKTVIQKNGSIRLTKTTKVTGKGQQYFINKFLKE